MQNLIAKIDSYQKCVFSWGFFVLIGYLLQNYFNSVNNIIISWTVVIAAAVFVQFYLFWSESGKIKLLNVLWLAISLLGGVLTYFIWIGTAFPDLKINVMWFVLVSVGMLLTGVITYTKKYFALFIIYFAIAAVFQFVNFEHDLIYAGIAFLLVNVLDGVWA